MMWKKCQKCILIFISYWLPFFVWSIVIFSFSSNPTVKTSEIHWQDFLLKKTAHVVEYFIFSLLLYRALINSGIKSKKMAIIVVISAFIYGLTDEFHQSFTPGREPKLRDVLIDTFGSILFIYSLKNIILKNNKLKELAEKVQIHST